MVKSYLLLGAAVVALAPVSASAQETPGGPSPAPQTASDSGDIVVTAQRREERLRDVPISITALSSEALETNNIDSARDLSLVTPGLNYSVQGIYAQPTIRGIGTLVTTPGADANVSLYIDGVYQPNQVGNALEFNNVERIEVLKGPQGTLFGRNSTGGAIRIITSDPDLVDAGLKGGLSYGRFNAVKATVYASLPLSDTLAVNVSGLYRHDDGFVTNLFNGHELSTVSTRAVRGKILWQPTDNLEIVLGANYAYTRDNTGYSYRPLGGNNAFIGPNFVVPASRYEVVLNDDPVSGATVKDANLRISWDVGGGTISSITSIQKAQPSVYSDTDGSPTGPPGRDYNINNKTFAEDLNYTSDLDGPFNWTMGAFFYDDKSELFLKSGPVVVSGYVKTRAVAVYGEANVDFTDRVHLIAGLRYSDERKHAVGGTGGPPLVDTTEKWDSFTPRVSLRYDLSNSTNIYASFSRGFKTGNFNLPSLTPVPVDPEEVTAYEVGLKRSGGGFTFNIGAYYYDYKNIQVQIANQVGNVAVTVLQNAASAEIYGFDFDTSYQVNDNLTLFGGLAYNHARYVDFTDASVFNPIIINGEPRGNVQVAEDASGNHLIRSPDFTFNLGGTLTIPVGAGAIEISPLVSHNGGFYWDPGERIRQPAHTLVNGRITWRPDDDRYSISLWGENLLNEVYLMHASPSASGNNGSYALPVTFGVSLDFKL